MFANRTLSDQQILIRRHFTDFFESERNEAKYHRRVQEMIERGSARLLLDMGDLLDFVPANALESLEYDQDLLMEGNLMLANPNKRGDQVITNPLSLGAGIIRSPNKYIPLLELALHEVVLRVQPEYLKVDYRSRPVHVGFEGPVGTIRSPRELYARHLNTMVALEGVITRQSTNRPRMVETVHYCRETNKFTRKEFRDQLTPMLDSGHAPTVNVMPKTDMEGHALRTELGLSTFIDSQCAILQEAPEKAPTGQLPRNVELRFDDDLVDSVKPGDRVLLVGVYIPYTTNDNSNKSFQTIVVVNHVVATQAYLHFTKHVSSVEETLKRFACCCVNGNGQSTILATLSHAIAPTVYGLKSVKEAILLLLVGGVERHAHSTHIRGDINVLLVGEPSTAKSQLLRFVLGVAPLALSTTGKGSSGVGLTAAVTVDAYSHERSLSAGAMVLADRGILCIDEFDKMNSQDRVAMHEAMEQQTVTIAKAGIHASLNARCSVLAAANPIYGFYSVHHKLAFNVGLPESLLSRFDLTFIILDQHSSEHNRRIGSHILHNHMFSEPVGIDPIVTRTVVDSAEQTWAQHIAEINFNTDNIHSTINSSNDVHDEMRYGNTNNNRFDIHNNLNHSNHSVRDDMNYSSYDEEGSGGNRDINEFTASEVLNTSTSSSLSALQNKSSGTEVVRVEFLRAYLQLAKQGTPLLTEHAQQLIVEAYVSLREEQQDGARDGFFITARTLEAIVRLATAHAKLRLSDVVNDEDVNAAMRLLRASVHAASSAEELREVDNAEVRKTTHLDQSNHSNNNIHNSTLPANGVQVIQEAGSSNANNDSRKRARSLEERDANIERWNLHKSNIAQEQNIITTTENNIMSSETEEWTTTRTSSREVQRAVIDVLKKFRNDGSSTLRLSEIHARLNVSVPMRVLRSTLEQMQGDTFVLESYDPFIETDNNLTADSDTAIGNDVIQLLEGKATYSLSHHNI